MKVSQLRVKPLANDLAITHHNRPDKRIRTDPPATTLRKLQSPLQVFAIRSFQRCVHID
jgi:hypothetical protein